jgi:hypothetical protein
MRRVRVAVVVIGLVLAGAVTASGDESPVSAPGAVPAASSAPGPAASSAPGPAPLSARTPGAAIGPASLAVVALPGAADAAWTLARSVYADEALRPATVDEAHARVLCGEPPAEGVAAELRDLADTVAALRGDDAPSRTLLDGIGRRFALRALVVVRADEGHPTARLFLTETGAFDAATYAPDAPATGPAPSWSATIRSLDRLFGPTPPPPRASSSAPTLATREVPRKETPGPRPFYESGWFWGALGAAALLGGAAYIATRDSSPSAIHLEVQVPH